MSDPTFSDEIRQAVDGSGLSRYQICKRIGLTQGTMSRFMNAKGGLTLANLDKLAALLGLAVVVKRSARKGKVAADGDTQEARS